MSLELDGVFPGPVVTNGHRLGGQNNRDSFPYVSGHSSDKRTLPLQALGEDLALPLPAPGYCWPSMAFLGT